MHRENAGIQPERDRSAGPAGFERFDQAFYAKCFINNNQQDFASRVNNSNLFVSPICYILSPLTYSVAIQMVLGAYCHSYNSLHNFFIINL